MVLKYRTFVSFIKPFKPCTTQWGALMMIPMLVKLIKLKRGASKLISILLKFSAYKGREGF